ncbi:MAG: acetylxylan esterase [Bacteroidota bacterium]
MRTRLLFLSLGVWAAFLVAQPKKEHIALSVVPTANNWEYALGERADFEIRATKNGKALKNATLSYEIGLEGMPSKLKKKVSLSDKETIVVKGIALNEPGFVRCSVTLNYQEHTYRALGAAAVAPTEIKPTVTNPDDFDAFWSQAKAELAKIPINAKLTLQPALSKAGYEVYHVAMDNLGASSWYGDSKFYGMLSIPTKPGTYPAVLEVPGAGVRPYFADDRARDGIIVLKVGIHGVPVNMEKKVYDALAKGALATYASSNMHDKDQYYYKRVYLGCLRAVDFIHSLEKFDGEHLVVSGGSQGGALSIVTAALDDRIKGLVAFYPALSDMTGYLYGRVGGWPHQFKGLDPALRPFWETTAGYYDVVNFAKRIKVPGWYSWGYNDPICPPTTMFSVYNSIKAPKELRIFEETGHWTYPEQWELAHKWIMDQLKD